jgi:hypothetical protein
MPEATLTQPQTTNQNQDECPCEPCDDECPPTCPCC